MEKKTTAGDLSPSSLIRMRMLNGVRCEVPVAIGCEAILYLLLQNYVYRFNHSQLFLLNGMKMK